MSSNPFDDLDEDAELAKNPFDVLDQHLPPLPRHSPTPKMSPKLKPAKHDAGAMPRVGSGGSLASMGTDDHEFEIQGLPGGGADTRPRRGSKGSMAESEMGGSVTDPNYVPTDYVLKLLNDVEEDPPGIRFENTAQYKAAIMMPLREGEVHKYQFVYHVATKAYQLQNMSTGAVLLIGKKRTDGFKMISTAYNFSICFPGAPNEIPFKLRGNTTGSEFTLYDDGFNPYKLDRFDKSSPRQEMAIIRVAIFPRIMSRRAYTLIIPREGVKCQPMDIKDSLASWEGKGLGMVRRYVSILPGARSTAELPMDADYHGLATGNSIKNFMLHRDGVMDGEPRMVLVNGKQTKHSSFVLVGGPDMNLLLAFATTLVAWVSLHVPSKSSYGL